eukprot:COSAG06_NODE_370_length_16728_cov_5.639004_12_plen_54_part_00
MNQTKMTGTMDRMAARTRSVNGKPTSLLDLGYQNVGLVSTVSTYVVAVACCFF